MSAMIYITVNSTLSLIIKNWDTKMYTKHMMASLGHQPPTGNLKISVNTVIGKTIQN